MQYLFEVWMEDTHFWHKCIVPQWCVVEQNFSAWNSGEPTPATFLDRDENWISVTL